MMLGALHFIRYHPYLFFSFVLPLSASPFLSARIVIPPLERLALCFSRMRHKPASNLVKQNQKAAANTASVLTCHL